MGLPLDTVLNADVSKDGSATLTFARLSNDSHDLGMSTPLYLRFQQIGEWDQRSEALRVEHGTDDVPTECPSHKLGSAVTLRRIPQRRVRRNHGIKLTLLHLRGPKV